MESTDENKHEEYKEVWWWDGLAKIPYEPPHSQLDTYEYMIKNIDIMNGER